MNISLPDTYVIRARLIPAVMALASGIALALVLARYSDPGLPEIIAAVVALMLVSMLADFARRHGQRIEPRLFAEMGGKPSTIMLRHRDQDIAPATKARLHEFLGTALGASAPTAEAEANDLQSADAFYAEAGDWLRAQTGNDKQRYHLVFAELTSYGFRRNLYGLRRIGFLVAVLTGLLSGTILFFPEYMAIGSDRFSSLWSVIGISCLQALYFFFVATRSSVVAGARTYARQLLLSQHLMRE